MPETAETKEPDIPQTVHRKDGCGMFFSFWDGVKKLRGILVL